MPQLNGECCLKIYAKKLNLMDMKGNFIYRNSIQIGFERYQHI